jgi:XTP/dITP diphosphohydrolase
VAAQHALQESNVEGVVAEDAGFFVEALNGFPGPYSEYTYRKIGVDGILKLLQATDQRNASFTSAVAYYDKWKRSACFEGIVEGRISLLPKGVLGFGFDPIFIPSNGGDRTFAEMETSEKNKFSHRAQAFSKFFKWIKTTHSPND